MIADDQDEKIMLAALLEGIWPRSPFMAELARKTIFTLREFMDRADDFVNAEDTLIVLTVQLERRKKIKEEEPVNDNERQAKKYCTYHKTMGHRTKDWRILFDNGSSADILFYDAFSKMGIGEDHLKPTPATLKGFTGDAVQLIGSITLPRYVGADPYVTTAMTEFLVVRTQSAYNAIIRRPTLNTLKAITSTYHLRMKSQTRAGIGEVHGEQVLARECYVQELRQGQREASIGDTKEHTVLPPRPQVMITELETRDEDALKQGEADEPLELVTLEQNHPESHIKIETKLAQKERQQLIDFLLDHKYVFVWNHKDMPRIGEEVIEHKLNVDPKARPIDLIVDAIAGHKMLSFMDAYSGYIQIKMKEADQEKTTFITDRGLYCYKVMSLGLKIAPATYQRLVKKIFKDQIGRNMEVFVDDLLVKSRELYQHVEDLKEAFQVFRWYQMKLNPTKCAFRVQLGKFLGFMVSESGIEANAKKLRVIIEMKSPTNLNEVQRQDCNC
ncbi:hypothetical protein F2P56_000936 [Juglans regia]|uniref:Reverse transcriptase domain-containing protein n=2 Tax=Juglans regia TaxID=51240 RepID=A0A834D7Y8_JUGRE|nr:uncharacterized protein LOC108987976 [Juglans regia]KAF5480170.1 hypothetical protein F2P56_000936 [Juglans regia]